MVLSNNLKKNILLILSCLCMLAIFILSSFPAAASSEQSEAVMVLFSNFREGNFTPQVLDIIEFIIRKFAHILEFALLGGLWYGYFLHTSLSHNKKKTFAFLISVTYAISDEVHQYFVEGRAARVYDVAIDTIGVILGILAVMLICLIIKKRGKIAD